MTKPTSQSADKGRADLSGPGSIPDGQRQGTYGRGDASYQKQIGANLASQHREESRARADFRESRIISFVHSDTTIYQPSFGRGADQVRVSQVSAVELTEPFVSSPAAERLAEKIADYPFVVLFGPRGYGKRATLLWALRHQIHNDTTVLYLDPSTDLATFSCADMPEYAVMIMQDVPDGTVNRLSEHAVMRIESELRAGKCRLAITTSRAATEVTRSAGFLVEELATRPEPRQVFSRHLSKLLQGTGFARDEVLGWDGVNKLVDELGPDSSLGDAARLAQLLADADRTELDQVAASVRAQMIEYADEKVAQWFRKLETLKAQCMAISLAVLNGHSRALIAREAAMLEKRILLAADASSTPSAVNPFGEDAKISLSLLDAQVTSETRLTEHGPIVQAISYQERGYSGQVLRYVGRVYDSGLAAIVGWLRDLGTSPDLTVRVRAATATGVLACQALDFVYDEVILPWAMDSREVVRDSAALALGAPVEDEVLRPTVWSLVNGWAHEGSDRRLRATAARVYGRIIGLASPSAALDNLWRLAEVDDIGLTVAVANSYCELVFEGTASLAIRVLAEVERLAADRMRERQAAGRLTIVGLTHLRGVPPGVSKHEERLRDWPTLLVLAVADPRIAESAARLWQLALNDRDIGEMARDSLDSWAEVAEGSSDLRAKLMQFLRSVTADERVRQAVTRQAQAWVGQDGRAPVTGRALMATRGYELANPLGGVIQAVDSGFFTAPPNAHPSRVYVVSYRDGHLRSFAGAPSATDRISARFCYLVDTSEQHSAYTCTASSAVDAYSFSVELAATWRVADPEAAVRADLSDGSGLVLATLEYAVWQIARGYRPEEAAAAENAVRASLAREISLASGIVILHTAARFHTDSGLIGATKDRDTAQHQVALERDRMTQLQELFDGPEDGALMLHLLQHPNDTATVLGALKDSRERSRRCSTVTASST